MVKDTQDDSGSGRKPASNYGYLIIAIFLLAVFILKMKGPTVIKLGDLEPPAGTGGEERETTRLAAKNDMPSSGSYNPSTYREHDTVQVNPGDVNLSIVNNGFVPVQFKGPASSTPLNVQLQPQRPAAIRKIPVYSGHTQWYGELKLGNRNNNHFQFVLDQRNDGRMFMYFDRNNNGDLTDDGQPLVNQGSGNGGPGGFACRIGVPWDMLVENSPFQGNFNIWFFSNKSGWKQGQRVSHYSQTQLEGKLRLGNREYTALLIDQGYNDADLTNDGVLLDLNGNGRIDRNERAGTSYTIDGDTYRFHIRW